MDMGMGGVIKLFFHKFEYLQNKCSVGPETSRPEVEKLAARVSFPREKVFIPRSDSCVAEAGGRGYTVRPRNEFRGLTVV